MHSSRSPATGILLTVLIVSTVPHGLSAQTGPTPAHREDRPAQQRKGIGMSLSGGGKRAALFHLGALRRLNELGILHRVDEVSSVSGGSLASAHLATYLTQNNIVNLQQPIPPADWEKGIWKTFQEFVKSDIRTRPFIRRFLPPWNLFKASVEVDTLAREIQQRLTPLMLVDLPEHPDFVLDATDLAFGVNWEFRRRRMGDYLAGYITPPPKDWPLAKAVAASNCFPPIFQPMPIRFSASEFKGGDAVKSPDYAQAIADVRLTDGGNYDNFGLEPIWKDREIVLVSDGGGTFDFEPDNRLIWRILRYPSILDNQARALHKRWLYASFRNDEMRGAYWRISNARNSYLENDTAGYSKELAERFIAKVRTDLNGFSEAESKILENHGYFLADAAIRAFLSDLVQGGLPELKPPHPEWVPPQVTETTIKKALFPDYRGQ